MESEDSFHLFIKYFKVQKHSKHFEIKQHREGCMRFKDEPILCNQLTMLKKRFNSIQDSIKILLTITTISLMLGKDEEQRKSAVIENN